MYTRFTRIAHWAIIIMLLQEFIYAGYMVFFVVRPSNLEGPLWQKALEIPFEMMITRRLYALEAWISGSALAIYLGITEIYPRRHRKL